MADKNSQERIGKREPVTPEVLCELMGYDPKTGRLTWLERRPKWFKDERHHKAWNARYAGREALTTSVKGYFAGTIFDKHLYAHRAAFCIAHGYWPKFVDHINQDKKDNRLENLREVTHVQNMRNLPVLSTNSSGVPGVSFLPHRSKWKAAIGVDRKFVFLGEYDTKEKAIIARAAAEKVLGFADRSALHAQEGEG